MSRASSVLTAGALFLAAVVAHAADATTPTLPPVSEPNASVPMSASPTPPSGQNHIAPIPANENGCGCGCGGCGVPRPGFLQQLVGYFTYVRSRSDNCPCCNRSGCHVPPLYTYFLCPGCTLLDRVSPPCGYNDEAPPFKCTQGPGCGCGR
jgi:hypothetical protein